MQLLIKIVSVALILLHTSNAGDICAYTTDGCGGLAGCCNHFASGECCAFASGYGLSAHWFNIDRSANPNLEAYIYSSTTCGNYLNQIGNVGASGITTCYNLWGKVAHSGDWWTSRLDRRLSRRESDCKEFDSIGFRDSNGTFHEFKVPNGKGFRDIEKLVKEEEFEQVFALERVRR
ncbi:hypothetical protein CPB83DRAFT_851715 [Crepidotus variabilis]|uniref:Uncharacterized protein n=1 Tax=Crepidotus variabilis TaxID=179855 RepID=A0A9P6JRT4_9AGAR|nr:hypothetical protein CPB83DRAFT_851715 [Crepidotus variabilis]